MKGLTFDRIKSRPDSINTGRDLISERLLETINIGGRRLVTLRSIDDLIERAAVGDSV